MGVKSNISQGVHHLMIIILYQVGRAREARKHCFTQLQSSINLISVVGYGPDRLLNKDNPNAANKLALLD